MPRLRRLENGPILYYEYEPVAGSDRACTHVTFDFNGVGACGKPNIERLRELVVESRTAGNNPCTVNFDVITARLDRSGEYPNAKGNTVVKWIRLDGLDGLLPSQARGRRRESSDETVG